jgi:hypothetical protein
MQPLGAELRLSGAGQSLVGNLPGGLAPAMFHRETGDRRNAVAAFAQSGARFIQSEAERAHHAGCDDGHPDGVWWLVSQGDFSHFQERRMASILFAFTGKSLY